MSTETQSIDAPRQPPSGKLTYEEFLDWCDEDTLAEWVDGEVVVTSPGSRAHQDLLLFLATFMHMIVKRYGLGDVLIAPFQMRLRDVNRGREPDILFVAQEHIDRLRPTYLDGPADLVVEITSPESFARDRGDKFVEYEKAGVPEYWLLDRNRRHAEFYQLDESGQYRLMFGGQSGEYVSRALPKLRLQVEWLWQEPLPDVLDVLHDLELI